MDEAEWLACDDPELMLDDLRGKASDRKFRLVVCACARRVWGSLDDERCRRGVEGLEGFADGRGGREDYERVAIEIRSPVDCVLYPHTDTTPHPADTPKDPYRYFVGVGTVVSPHSSVGFYWTESLLDAYVPAGRWGIITEVLAAKGYPTVHHGDPLFRVIPTAAVEDLDEERRAHLALVRDIFGNPFHPITLSPVWRTSTVLALAEAAYEHRQLPPGHLDEHRLAVLADALEETGCDDAPLLEHLRGGRHVRGCVAVDAVLGKS